MIDSREKNQTDPRTQWFIAKTDFGRTLKVCFLEKADGVHIKTAYEPNEEEVRIYAKYSK